MFIVEQLLDFCVGIALSCLPLASCLSLLHSNDLLASEFGTVYVPTVLHLADVSSN